MSFDKPNSPETGSGLPKAEKDDLFTSRNTGARYQHILTNGETVLGIAQSHLTDSEYEKKRKREEEDRQRLFMTLAQARLEELRERLDEIYYEQEQSREKLVTLQARLKEDEIKLAKTEAQLTAIEKVEALQQTKEELAQAEQERNLALANGEATHHHDANCTKCKHDVVAKQVELQEAQINLKAIAGEEIPPDESAFKLSTKKIEIIEQKEKLHSNCNHCKKHIEIEKEKIETLNVEAEAIKTEVSKRENETTNDRSLTKTFNEVVSQGINLDGNLAKAGADEITGTLTPQAYDLDKAAKMEEIKNRVDHGVISVAELNSLTDGMSAKQIASIETSLHKQGVTIAPLGDNVPHAEHVPISSQPKSGLSELKNQFASAAEPVIETIKGPEPGVILAKQYSMSA